MKKKNYLGIRFLPNISDFVIRQKKNRKKQKIENKNSLIYLWTDGFPHFCNLDERRIEYRKEQKVNQELLDIFWYFVKIIFCFSIFKWFFFYKFFTNIFGRMYRKISKYLFSKKFFRVEYYYFDQFMFWKYIDIFLRTFYISYRGFAESFDQNISSFIHFDLATLTDLVLELFGFRISHWIFKSVHTNSALRIRKKEMRKID